MGPLKTQIKDNSEQMDSSTMEEGNADNAVDENVNSIRSDNQEPHQSPRKSESAITGDESVSMEE